jgi:hypothetical protein
VLVLRVRSGGDGAPFAAQEQGVAAPT